MGDFSPDPGNRTGHGNGSSWWSRALDIAFGSTVGGVLVRKVFGWQSLPPASIGEVLTIGSLGNVGWASTATTGITELVGDVTTTAGTGIKTATLATVNSSPGSFTNASLTVNGKGLVTAASSGTAPITAVGAGLTLSGSTVSETIPILYGAGGDIFSIAAGGGLQGGSYSGTVSAAFGVNALGAVTTGVANVAVGFGALASNTSGTANMAFGSNALTSLTTGSGNAAIGVGCLANSVSDSFNTAIGRGAGLNVNGGSNNTIIGYETWSNGNCTGSNNVIIGYQVASNVLETGSNNILIGTSGSVDTPATSTSNYLNIGGVLYGEMTASLTCSLPLVISPGYTVATLPGGTIGMRAYVTDALAPTFLGPLTGGHSTVCPVFYNGSAWVAG